MNVLAYLTIVYEFMVAFGVLAIIVLIIADKASGSIGKNCSNLCNEAG